MSRVRVFETVVNHSALNNEPDLVHIVSTQSSDIRRPVRYSDRADFYEDYSQETHLEAERNINQKQRSADPIEFRIFQGQVGYCRWEFNSTEFPDFVPSEHEPLGYSMLHMEITSYDGVATLEIHVQMSEVADLVVMAIENFFDGDLCVLDTDIVGMEVTYARSRERIALIITESGPHDFIDQ